MEGINFGGLAVWVLSPDWLSRKSDFCQALWWSRRAWRGECGPCPDFALYTLAFALQLRKITENLSQGSKNADNTLVPGYIENGVSSDWFSQKVTLASRVSRAWNVGEVEEGSRVAWEGGRSEVKRPRNIRPPASAGSGNVKKNREREREIVYFTHTVY
jgi:hypothetical protein